MTDVYVAKFKCVCGEHTFITRYREKGEDLISWLDNVVRPRMYITHKNRTPSCQSPKCDLMLPVPENADGIGMRPKLDA